MLVFIANAKTTGAFVAIIVVDSISSAIPFATLPITLAVAGAISIKSALWAKEICWISHDLGSSNISTITWFLLKDWKLSGVTNSVAALVIITLTSISCFTRVLTISKDL